MNIVERLAVIQAELHAPKSQTNDFAKFNYRSAEAILEAVKPHMNGLVLMISDDIKEVGGRVYVKATAMLSDGDQTIETSAFARETLTKKGMDEAQITGSASSYARKYALNGLFAIDDNKDPDSVDNSNHVSLTDTDQQWIAAVKLDEVVLEQINDLDYRTFIKQEAAK